MGDLQRCFISELNKDFGRAVEALVDEIRENTPRDTGNLRSSIKASIGTFEVVVSTNTGEEYPSILDSGSGPYTIRARTKKALFWAGADHPVKEVNHPGSTKHKGWWDDAWEAGLVDFDRIVGC